MQNIHIRFWWLMALVLGVSTLVAQEQLVGLQLNPVQAQDYAAYKNQKGARAEVAPLFLPFLDNFDQPASQVDAKRWQHSNVFVNTSFQYRPADLGVATFDALMDNGRLYPQASPFAFPADTLTSQPIRLDSIRKPVLRPLTIKDSLYFSFYYQPQGRGDAPESMDVLSLEFFSPRYNLWYEVWSSQGMSLEAFHNKEHTYAKQVLIPLTDSVKYFAKGFMFRFHNKASLASSSQPDWQSNCDMWNIDMVYLNTDRNMLDSSYRKIAFVSPPPSMIKRYWSMPYKQYKNDPTNSMKDSLHNILISDMDKIAYIANYSYHISNQTSQQANYDGGSASVQPFMHYGYVDYPRFSDPPVQTFFSIHNQTGQNYKITHIIKDEGATGVGDTMVFWQEFRDYYAYDDGVPEAGYGFSVAGSKAALQFHLNTKDTLKQVKIYFNPTLSASNEVYFNLMVWKSLEPEKVLLSQRVKAKVQDGMFSYVTYNLDHELVIGNDFYVGVEQLTNSNLNIGFDYSQDSKEYLFYQDNSGQWYNSLFKGSLMVRPVLGTSLEGVEEGSHAPDNTWHLYPNPVRQGKLFVVQEGEWSEAYCQLAIYDMMGRQVRQMPWQNEIDVSALPAGMYFLRCSNAKTAQVSTQKFVIDGK